MLCQADRISSSSGSTDTVSQSSRHYGLVPFANFLVRYRIWLLLASVLLTVLSFAKASRLTLEHSIESLYALDDPHLLDYRESKSLFGGDEFIIVAFPDPDLLLPDRLDALRTFASQLSGAPESENQAPKTSPTCSRPPYLPTSPVFNDSCCPHCSSSVGHN